MKLPSADRHFQRYAEKGYYQRRTLCLAMSRVSRWKTAIDVGGHVGFMANDMARFFEQVHSFEPQPDNFSCLEQNKAENVTAYNVALGAVDGRAGLSNPSDYNSGGWIMGEGDSIDVRMLDSYNLQHVGLIKIDVQGNEIGVLKGAVETLRRWKPALMVEMPKDEVARLMDKREAPEIVSFLLGLGARLNFLVKEDAVLSWS